MKSWYAICGLTLTLFCPNVQAAPVHETARLTQDFVNGGWVDELYEGPGDFSVAPLAREEFRTIPQAQTISLHFGDPNRDLFAELITKREAAPIQFFYDWVGYLFGLRTWDIGDDPNLYARSGHARPFIPVPPELPMFFTLLALACMALILFRWRKRR